MCVCLRILDRLLVETDPGVLFKYQFTFDSLVSSERREGILSFTRPFYCMSRILYSFIFGSDTDLLCVGDLLIR